MTESAPDGEGCAGGARSSSDESVAWTLMAPELELVCAPEQDLDAVAAPPEDPDPLGVDDLLLQQGQHDDDWLLLDDGFDDLLGSPGYVAPDDYE